MKKFFLSVTVIILFATNLMALGLQKSDVSSQEYAVYSAVINSMFAGNKVGFDSQTEVKLLVIKDHTVINIARDFIESQDWKYLKEKFTEVSQESINDYAEKNKASYQLKDAFNIKINHTLIKKEDLENIFSSGTDRWQLFYKKFPDSGGFIAISRVGFNPAENQALVYIEHGCGGLCGTGHYLLLNRDAKEWKVKNILMAWIS